MFTIKPMAVLTRHKPSHARIYLRRLSGTRIGPLALCAVMLGMLVIAPTAGAAAGVDITTVEGQSFTGKVVDIGSCSLASATISWGDGATSAGTSDGGTGIQGTHTYAEEGTYSGSVSYTYTVTRFCPAGTQTTSFQATVQDALLTGAGRNVAGTAGQSLSAVVAHIDDANPAAGAGEFSAQIAWGDGARTFGTVAAAPAGGFDVTGTHVYATPGSYPVSIQIADLGGSSATVTSTGQIDAAPSRFTFAGAQAQFGFSPASPCRDRKVSFDASGSSGSIGPSGARLPISQYRWSIEESAFSAPSVVSASPSFTHVFRASSYSVGPYGGPLPNPDLYDYRFFRPPATVTLEVTDSGGKTASVTQRITFGNPDELLVGEVPTDPATGLPEFSKPISLFRDSRFANFIPCEMRPSLKLVASAALKLGRIRLKATYATVHSSGAGAGYRASIIVKSSCTSSRVRCFGELIVSQGARAGRGQNHIPGNPVRGLLAGSLGHATVFVHAGSTAAVIVKLNSRGRALARAHALRTVILELRSLGGTGKLVTSRRPVSLRFR
jgi:hypothetical protein